MEFKGTKGNWEINPKATRNVRCRGITVANTSQGQSGDNEEEEQANALLISKAPEILDFLKIIAYDEIYNVSQSVKENAKQLIKEATQLTK